MFVLNETPSIANHFLAELRDKVIQKNRSQFRQNLIRLGEMLAYELSKSLEYDSKEVATPLGMAKVDLLREAPVLITIMRAGIPFFEGFLNIFNHSDCGFIGAYRNGEGDDASFEINMEYVATANIEGKEIIVIDPMLATGQSLIASLQALVKYGKPKHVHVAAAFAAPEGIKYLNEQIELPHSFWFAAVDEKLNHKAYIVPGLGDAGDLSFGNKI